MLEHIKPGRTMMVLLHEVEAIDTIKLSYQFDRFSIVRLFELAPSHVERSSFYIVALDISD